MHKVLLAVLMSVAVESVNATEPIGVFNSVLIPSVDSFGDISGTLYVPAKFKLVGHPTSRGGFLLSVVAQDIQATSPQDPLISRTYDCINDRLGFEELLTFASPAVSNVASEGNCTGYGTFAGPIHYLEFSASGDGGARLFLADHEGRGSFSIECSPAMGGVGVGVDDTWQTISRYEEQECRWSIQGVRPSQYGHWWGTVTNLNRMFGTVRAYVAE